MSDQFKSYIPPDQDMKEISFKAILLGIIPRKKSTVEAIKKVYSSLQLHTYSFRDTISVRKTTFLKTRSPEHLLALAGFHNRVSTFEWYHMIQLASKRKGKPVNLRVPEDVLKKQIQRDLDHLAFLE